MEILVKDLWKIMANLPDPEEDGHSEYVVPVLEEINLTSRKIAPDARVEGKYLVFKKVVREGKVRWALKL